MPGELPEELPGDLSADPVASPAWTVGIVGAGVMAEALLIGLLAQGHPPDRILASHHRADRRADLAARYGVPVTASNEEAARQDVAVLAVKPQTLPVILEELSGCLRPETLLISILAGARLRLLQDGLDHRRTVRAMPNLPCRIRQGLTVWYGAPGLSREDQERTRSILLAMGQEIQVDAEDHVDRATAVSGTGPAIAAHFVKGWLEAAAYIGLPRAVARQAVLDTLAGTVALLRDPDRHVAELIDEVTSPGGTTTRALQVLKNGRFSAVLTEAVDAAFLRSKELGQQLDEKIQKGR